MTIEFSSNEHETEYTSMHRLAIDHLYCLSWKTVTKIQLNGWDSLRDLRCLCQRRSTFWSSTSFYYR